MSVNTKLTKAQLDREASNPLHSLFMTILIIGTLISFFGIAMTSEAPTDGPLPKTPSHSGELASGVSERIR
jgi:hypothetical protein